MGQGDIRVNLWDLLSSLARTFDLMSPQLAQHNLRVACLAARIAEAMPLSEAERADIALAGVLHDVGAFSLRERLDLLRFEDSQLAAHAKAGALLLRGFPPFEGLATLVLYHHLPWAHGKGAQNRGAAVPIGSHILHLADRAVVLINEESGVLQQVPAIRAAIAQHTGEIFAPQVWEAFSEIAGRDSVWLEVVSGAAADVLRAGLSTHSLVLDTEALLSLARLLCRVIDFKSEFTAAHSSGVAASGTALARLVGFSQHECRLFETAAYLHDLGKLAIPTEILEKPGRLTPEEWGVMRTHVYFTYQILCPLETLGVIRDWSALHQERVDGSGYPFGHRAEELPLGSRIMAVADVFTAITEDRPYRDGMPREEVERTLRDMAGQSQLDKRIVDLLLAHYEVIDAAREAAQTAARQEYGAFRGEITAWGTGADLAETPGTAK